MCHGSSYHLEYSNVFLDLIYIVYALGALHTEIINRIRRVVHNYRAICGHIYVRERIVCFSKKVVVGDAVRQVYYV